MRGVGAIDRGGLYAPHGGDRGERNDADADEPRRYPRAGDKRERENEPEGRRRDAVLECGIFPAQAARNREDHADEDEEEFADHDIGSHAFTLPSVPVDAVPEVDSARRRRSRRKLRTTPKIMVAIATGIDHSATESGVTWV